MRQKGSTMKPKKAKTQRRSSLPQQNQTCNKCGVIYPLTPEFFTYQRRKRGQRRAYWYMYCRICQKKQQDAYRKRNKTTNVAVVKREGGWNPTERDEIEQYACNRLIDYDISLSELEFENLMASLTGIRLPSSGP